jgi:hypothetical protein
LRERVIGAVKLLLRENLRAKVSIFEDKSFVF